MDWIGGRASASLGPWRGMEAPRRVPGEDETVEEGEG